MSGSYDLRTGSEKQDPGIWTDSILKCSFRDHLSDLGKAATFRDPTALAMVKEMAWELSIALSNLISTVNPSLIVLGGKIPALGEYFLNEVREDLKKTGFRRMADNVTVRYSQLQSDSFLNGAMKYFFDIHYSFTDQDPTNFFIG